MLHSIPYIECEYIFIFITGYRLNTNEEYCEPHNGVTVMMTKKEMLIKIIKENGCYGISCNGTGFDNNRSCPGYEDGISYCFRSLSGDLSLRATKVFIKMYGKEELMEELL